MKIQSILIDGFKNLSNVEIKLDRITALISSNNFGKSNVLDGIDFGLMFIKANTNDKADMMANKNLMPINKHTFNSNCKFEIEILSKVNGVEYNIFYGYEFTWMRDEYTDPCIISEYLKVKPGCKGRKCIQLISRDSKEALYRSTKTGRCLSKVNIEPTELVLNKLCAYDKVFFSEIIREIQAVEFDIKSNLDERNLAGEIYQLQKRNPNKFELLKQTYQKIFPDIEDIFMFRHKLSINCSINVGSIYALLVKQKNLPCAVDFSSISEGARKVFVTLARIILASENNVSLLAIEELENIISPSLLPTYIQSIYTLSCDCKIVVTSYSPYVINQLGLSEIYVGISKSQGIAEFHKIEKSGKQLLQREAAKFKTSIGDYLFSILSDKETDWTNYLDCEMCDSANNQLHFSS